MTKHRPDEHAPASSLTLSKAFRLVAGDLEPGSDVAFTDHRAQPDVIDKRVLLQSTWWIDVHATWHHLDDMSPDYRTNVLAHLEQESQTWIHQALQWVVVAALTRLIEPREARDQIELLDLLTPGWTDHTPLGQRLHHLNHTTPNPIAPPPTLTTAADTDHPEILREEDGGTWQITTVSTTVYLLDLDRHRIVRRPHTVTTRTSTRSGTPHPAAPLVSSLPYDGDWTELTGLIICRTGQSLLVLDERPEGGGYRISTAITDIQRLPDTRDSAPTGSQG